MLLTIDLRQTLADNGCDTYIPFHLAAQAPISNFVETLLQKFQLDNLRLTDELPANLECSFDITSCIRLRVKFRGRFL